MWLRRCGTSRRVQFKCIRNESVSVNEYANECEKVSASIDVAAEMRNIKKGAI
jgi:hypothetical protein